MKILHVLNHSVPHLDGYCIRSENIVRFQREIGLDPVVVTSPHHEPPAKSDREVLDDIVYYRTLPRGESRLPVLHELACIRRVRDRIVEVARAEAPAAIHAHSPCLWGKAAVSAAKRLGIPVIYEVRGLWEDASVDEGKITTRSLKYRLSRALESHVVHRADALVTISRGLQTEFISRGIEPGRIHLVPNGVNLDLFSDLPDGQATRERHGLDGKAVISYVGSLYKWEGVDLLIDAMRHVRREIPDCVLLVVGDGEQRSVLDQLVKRLSLESTVKLVGRVPHANVRDYYAVSDLLVYPRRKSRQTEMVTPLKPLEAMALSKAVLVSDVGGLVELIDDGAGATFTAGDSADLTRNIVSLLRDPAGCAELGRVARERVVATRAFPSIARRYLGVYAQIGAVRATDGGPRDASGRNEGATSVPVRT